jgi:hypothetical protein
MRRFALLLSLFALPIAFGATAGAAAPAVATGTISGGSLGFSGFHLEGGNEFVHITSAGATITGRFTGSLVTELDEVVHPTGNSTLQGSVVCDPCTVDGRSGTVIFRQAGTIVGDPFTFEARTASVSATGQLAGLHAEFVVHWNGVDPATYAGTYHFDP